MKTAVNTLAPDFQPRAITVTVESQAELDALHRMARTGLAKERTAAALNRTNTVSISERARLRAAGYGSDAGIESTREFFNAVIAAGGK